MRPIVMRRATLLLLTLACAGCATPALVVEAPVERLGRLAREPMLAEFADGTLFVAGYGSGSPSLWKSADRGATWSSVDVGAAKDGAIGNSDVDLAVAADGTLYFANMSFDRKAGEGRRIDMAVSRDGGATWRWSKLSETRFDDRPWVEVTPAGTAHVIWNDGAGVRHATSTDRGATWREGAPIHPKGGSSHLAIGPRGELAVRITPLSASGNKFDAGVDLVAVSVDDGQTWSLRPAPGQRLWRFPLDDDDPLPRWVEPLAWDEKGALYSLWGEPGGLWLARSTDQGATWASWLIAEGGDNRFFPYLVARAKGELAASWFTLSDKMLQAHVGLIRIGAWGPTLTQASAFQPDTWSRADAGKEPDPDTAGEYLALRFLNDGDLVVVSPVQNLRAQRAGFAVRRVRLSGR